MPENILCTMSVNGPTFPTAPEAVTLAHKHSRLQARSSSPGVLAARKLVSPRNSTGN